MSTTSTPWQRASAASDARARIASICLELEDASPLELLRAAPGARGFWARGERWVAHAGVLASVVAEPGPQRFREIGAAAARAVVGDPTWPTNADARLAGRLRFYGGFSFQHEPGSSHRWIGFPPALFHLPMVELEGDAEGVARLRVRAWWQEGDDEDVPPVRLERRARELAERLAASHAPRAGMPLAAGGDGRKTLHSVESDRTAWEAAVGRSLDAIRDGRVQKVVLARTLDVHPRSELDTITVLGQLWAANRNTHVFYFEPLPQRVILGAAPETIATLRRGIFHATAVAGSIPLGSTPVEQDELATRLLTSAKNRAEHSLALEDMVARLQQVAEGIRAESAPHVLALPAIQHLESAIRARVPGGTTVLDLLAALHPTPAVCGCPREEALELLAREEPFERGWYAGPVGWFDLDGNGAFAPAIRSAVLSEGAWRLYAGAGIVAGSRPDAEWIETGIKLEPVLQALAAASG